MIVFAPFILPVIGLVSLLKAPDKRAGAASFALSVVPLLVNVGIFVFSALPKAC